MDYLYFTEQDVNFEQNLLSICESMLKKLPNYQLAFKNVNGHHYFYATNKNTGKREYLSKGNERFMEQIKQRAFLELLCKRIRKNLKLQNRVTLSYEPYDFEVIRDSLAESYRDLDLNFLLEQIFGKAEKDRNGSFYNPYGEGEKTTITSFGLAVRSKSEALIAELLHREGIEFDYERELILQNQQGEPELYYPDFAIWIRSGELIYWEHLGRLDLEGYRNSNYKKLTDYYYNGIISPDNLIITMEALGGGVNMEAIERNIGWLKDACR